MTATEFNEAMESMAVKLGAAQARINELEAENTWIRTENEALREENKRCSEKLKELTVKIEALKMISPIRKPNADLNQDMKRRKPCSARQPSSR